MPITYRQHQDTRDGKIYNCVLMPDGKWWSAENLAWGSGYYLHENAQSAIPNGCHGPTQAEWDLLNSASGGGQYLKSAGGWAGFNGLDTYGFALSPTGYVDGVLQSSGRSYHAVFPYVSGGLRGFMSASPYSYAVGYGYSGNGQPYLYKIRFIVDVFNEPNPLKLFGATFQGFERGLSCAVKRQILVDDSMGGSVVLTPVAPAAFDEWAIEAELWVNAAQAQALEAIVPPRGVPLENAIRLPPRGGEASFPGLLPFAEAAGYDQYLVPMVTAFESLGQRAVGTDLFGYRIALSFFAEADGFAFNGSPTPTTTPPTWLAGKASLRTIVDASNQGPVVAATTLAGHPSPRGSFFPVKHGRNLPVSIALDNLPTDWASELVAYFRGVRHNATTLQISNGPSGVEAVSVYLVGLTFARTGLTWSGSLEVVPA